jgi:hypothetical protein
MWFLERKRKEMKRVFVILAATIVPVVLAVTAVSFAQQQQAPAADVVVRHRVMQGQEGPPKPVSGDFVFIASEIGFGGNLVKGAPYSAQSVTETIQTLGDGNRIVNRVSSTVYRDSEGRTRREQTLKGLGQLGDGGVPMQTVFIHDPVAGVSYSLDSRGQVANKMTPFKFEWKPEPGSAPPPPGGGPERRFEYRVEPGGAPPPAVVIRKTAPAVAGVQVGPPHPVEGGQFEIRTGGAVSHVFSRNGIGPNQNEVTEKLGTQIIEGVSAEGTRTTITIPAGEIGNDRAIEIVSERWYSPELQVVVMTRHNDPRFGETVYKLTNINRVEQPKSLFEVPPGYTVKEVPAMPPGVHMPAKMRKPPANPE